jgi:leader peptidase (prepilin peptidase)/N-methyltransferase
MEIAAKFIPVLILLAVLSVIDIRRREVPDIAVLAVCLYGLIAGPGIRPGLSAAAPVFVTGLFIAVITDGGLGGGDIKLLTSLAFFLGKDFLLFAWFLAPILIVALVYALITKKGLRFSVPLVPFIFAAFLCTAAFRWKLPLHTIL